MREGQEGWEVWGRGGDGSVGCIFVKKTATTELYPHSLHGALPVITAVTEPENACAIHCNDYVRREVAVARRHTHAGQCKTSVIQATLFNRAEV